MCTERPLEQRELDDGLEREIKDGVEREIKDGVEREIEDGLEQELEDGLDWEIEAVKNCPQSVAGFPWTTFSSWGSTSLARRQWLFDGIHRTSRRTPHCERVVQNDVTIKCL